MQPDSLSVRIQWVFWATFLEMGILDHVNPKIGKKGHHPTKTDIINLQEGFL